LGIIQVSKNGNIISDILPNNAFFVYVH